MKVASFQYAKLIIYYGKSKCQGSKKTKKAKLFLTAYRFSPILRIFVRRMRN